ncbi:MAG: hypothetical protein PHS37_08580, partial [Candidatus Omnitrophica bacterium]|nr:hypothetical protein [Candidatus Omnitrophota bacterium]
MPAGDNRSGNTTLAVPTALPDPEFREKFALGEFLFSFEGIKIYIEEQVGREKDIFAAEWKERRTEVVGDIYPWRGRIKGSKIKGLQSVTFIKVAALLASTGQAAMADLTGELKTSAEFGMPVIYIDSMLASTPDRCIQRHEIDEILQWEYFRARVLGIADKKGMAAWIRKYIDCADDSLKGTDYEGLNARQIAKMFCGYAYPLRDLYERLGRSTELDHRYIPEMLSLYGNDEKGAYVNIAGRAKKSVSLPETPLERLVRSKKELEDFFVTMLLPFDRSRPNHRRITIRNLKKEINMKQSQEAYSLVEKVRDAWIDVLAVGADTDLDDDPALSFKGPWYAPDREACHVFAEAFNKACDRLGIASNVKNEHTASKDPLFHWYPVIETARGDIVIDFALGQFRQKLLRRPVIMSQARYLPFLQQVLREYERMYPAGAEGLIGKYALRKVEQDEPLKRNGEGLLIIDAYDLEKKEDVLLRIPAVRAPPYAFKGFRETKITAIDLMLHSYHDHLVRDFLYLRPNEYGIHGIGTTTLLAVDESLKDNDIALFHEVAHGALASRQLPFEVFIKYGLGGEAALDEFINKEGKSRRLHPDMKVHYALRLFQKQRWPQDDSALTETIKTLPGTAGHAASDHGPAVRIARIQAAIPGGRVERIPTDARGKTYSPFVLEFISVLEKRGRKVKRQHNAIDVDHADRYDMGEGFTMTVMDSKRAGKSLELYQHSDGKGNADDIGYGVHVLSADGRTAELAFHIFKEYRQIGDDLAARFFEAKLRYLYHVKGVRRFVIPRFQLGMGNSKIIDADYLDSGAMIFFVKKFGFSVHDRDRDGELKAAIREGHTFGREELKQVLVMNPEGLCLDLSGSPGTMPVEFSGGELQGLIGNYAVHTIEQDEALKKKGKGMLIIDAYSLMTRQEVTLHIPAEKARPYEFDEFRRTGIMSFDNMLLSYFNKAPKEYFYLKPNRYGVHGIGTKNILAIAEALKHD